MGTIGNDLWSEPLYGGPASSENEPTFAVSEVLSQLYPRLHATGAIDLVGWTEAELIDSLQAALDRLARATGVFVHRVTQPTAMATPSYPLPAGSVAVIHCAVNGSALTSSTREEAEAEDPAYLTAQDTPLYWYTDGLNQAALGLTPVPIVAGQDVAIVERYRPPAAAVVPAPPIVAQYLEDAVLYQSYAKPGDFQCPDIAQHLAERLAWWESIFAALHQGWR